MGNGWNSELGKLIINQVKLFNTIFEAVRIFAIVHKNGLNFFNIAFSKGYISLKDMEVAAAQSLHDTACQMICKWMDRKKWNSAIFKERTFLSAEYYSKLRNSPTKQIELPALISICIGLDIESISVNDLIRRAGFTYL